MQLDLLNLTLWLALGIGIIVSGVLIYVVLRFRMKPGDEKSVPKQIEGNHRLEIVWTIIPIVILAVVAVPTVKAAFETHVPAASYGDPMTITATGHQWWFEFEYAGLKNEARADGRVVTANELWIPVGKPVIVKLTSDDVIHSFWVPKLAGKVDMIPGRTNQMWLKADEAGIYYGQCAEYCGSAHANMRFRVIAVSQSDYDKWIAHRQTAVAAPTDAQAIGGKALFEGEKGNNSYCFKCHAIDGSAKANGATAPNLSNIGSRTTLGAGIIPNTDENLRKWIKDPTSIKPGVKMPRHPGLTNEELDQIVAYLRSLNK
jgi:cytochrome c oxidase subunit 2